MILSTETRPRGARAFPVKEDGPIGLATHREQHS